MITQLNLPSSLLTVTQQQWQDLLGDTNWQALDLTSTQQQQLHFVFACSPFLVRLATQWPEAICDCFKDNRLNIENTQVLIDRYLPQTIASIPDQNTLDHTLRKHRAIEMFIIAWRDILGLAKLEETMAHISLVADWAINLSHDWHLQQLVQEQDLDAASALQQYSLIILAMGKLGGAELNYSSDIDLIFFFPGSAYDKVKTNGLNKEQFYTRLSQKIIQSLDKVTQDGFVFRVDMRLRPYGDSGPIAMSAAAAEDYYQDQGRDWERYALIKARCITGKESYQRAILPVIKPFVFRKYIDFGVLESIREMKLLIQKELRRKSLTQNIKLGAGGIREIEFICQSMQLIRGGRNIALQDRSLLKVYHLLEQENYLASNVVADCLKAYCFLRKLEHAIQEMHDQQTQDLPTNDTDQLRLQLIMGFDTYADLLKRLEQLRTQVHQHFQAVVGEPDEPETHQDNAFTAYQDTWLEAAPENNWATLFGCDNYQAPEQAQALVLDFKRSLAMRHLGQRGQRRLNNIMPGLLLLVSKVSNPDETLQRVIKLLTAILRRTAYLVLLDENQLAMTHLVRLCSASEWISEHLANYPILLDELLDHRILLNPPKANELTFELSQHLLRINQDDIEAMMDALRQFKLAIMLKLAAAYLVEAINEVTMSQCLTALAEQILRQVLILAFRELVDKFGLPAGSEGLNDLERVFAVFAYGKFGSQELSLRSDLDIVFIHALDTSEQTQHESPLELGKFVLRFAQRVINLLGMRTGLGRLYEVDLRLRPSGNSGLLVSELSAFEEYQQNEAWVWEHQALLKARCVFGESALTNAITNIRSQCLLRPRLEAELATDICQMRTKMRTNLDRSNKHVFDLKQGEGVLVDIEFLVQFWLLSLLHENPQLLDQRSTESALKQLKKDTLIPQSQANALLSALVWLRQQIHCNALQGRNSLIPAEQVQAHCAKVRDIWQTVFNPFLPSKS